MLSEQTYTDDVISSAGEDISSRQQAFSVLKQQVSLTEAGGHNQYLSCDVPHLDKALGGGLRYGHVHLFSGRYDDAAATGFSLAVLQKMMAADNRSAVIWCAPPYSAYQGRLCCEGLAAQGIDPGRIIFVHEQNPSHLLSAFEEALQTRSVMAVLCEYGVLYQKPDIWQRRILRARRSARSSGAMGMLIGADAPYSGVETAWLIRSQPAADTGYDWRPLWHVDVRYARQGHPCQMQLRWDSASVRLRMAQQHSVAEDALAVQPVQVPSNNHKADNHKADHHKAGYQTALSLTA